MKKHLILSLLVLALALPMGLSAQNNQDTVTVFDNIVLPKEHSKQDIQVKTIDNFELAEEWTSMMPREQGIALRKKITGKAKSDTSASQYCIGVKFITYTRGFNWVEIKPPSPILIPGTTKAIAVTVAGRNLRHNLVAWVQDYRGIEYRIELGNINFKGWQRVAAPIPAYVKQYSRYVPEYRPLKLTKLVLEFDPDEMPGDYYIYLDNFEAAVDLYKPAYDGDDLLDDVGTEKWEKEVIAPETDKSRPQGGQ